jgi:hypothetical protein
MAKRDSPDLSNAVHAVDGLRLHCRVEDGLEEDHVRRLRQRQALRMHMDKSEHYG